MDSSQGYGPEHYYSGCTLEPGDYVVKVNYYYGTAPSTATVKVTAGSEYFTRTMVLPTAYYGSGDGDPPYTFCTINVATTTVPNSYKYRITPA